MTQKFQKGELVRFTEFKKFGDSDLYGHVHDYFGSEVGLNHYVIKEYPTKNCNSTVVYFRTTKYMKKVSKEEEFLLILEK